MPQSKETRPQPEPWSILGQQFVEFILEGARHNLQKDGSLAPMLFFEFKNGEQGILPLTLPATVEERQDYFRAIGISLSAAGKAIDQALFLCETWYVESEEGKRLALDVPPRRHPNRRQAITVMGRDAERTRYTAVIQLFHRDRQQRPVFEPITQADYDAFITPGTGPVGLIDHLFPNRSRLLN